MAELTLGESTPEQEPAQAEPTQEQVQTETVQPEQQTQPPQTTIPEQYRDKTPEELYQEIHRLSSANGRLKAELQRPQQQSPQYQPPVYQPQYPSSLPGQEALGRSQPQKNLDEVFWENPSKVLAEVVGQQVAQGIQSYEYQQTQKQQQAVMAKVAQINQWDNEAIDSLRRESLIDESFNFTDEHEAMMEALAKRDKDVATLLNKPNITRDEVFQTVRKLHAKADTMLKGDPEKLKAFTAATKQVAINGAPATKASSTTGPADSSPIEHWDNIDPTGRLKEEYSFMVDLVNKSQS